MAIQFCLPLAELRLSTANTRNDDTWRANLASKRSRSPRGESSYQVSQIAVPTRPLNILSVLFPQ